MLSLALVTSFSLTSTAVCRCARGQGATYVGHVFHGTCNNITGTNATRIVYAQNSNGGWDRVESFPTVQAALRQLQGSSCVTTQF